MRPIKEIRVSPYGDNLTRTDNVRRGVPKEWIYQKPRKQKDAHVVWTAPTTEELRQWKREHTSPYLGS